jgi:hypothetical protein
MYKRVALRGGCQQKSLRIQERTKAVVATVAAAKVADAAETASTSRMEKVRPVGSWTALQKVVEARFLLSHPGTSADLTWIVTRQENAEEAWRGQTGCHEVEVVRGPEGDRVLCDKCQASIADLHLMCINCNICLCLTCMNDYVLPFDSPPSDPRRPLCAPPPSDPPPPPTTSRLCRPPLVVGRTSRCAASSERSYSNMRVEVESATRSKSSEVCETEPSSCLTGGRTLQRRSKNEHKSARSKEFLH